MKSVLLFLGVLAIGVVAGTRIGDDPFGKYARSAKISEMDWLLVKVNLATLYAYAQPDDRGLALPGFFYDPERRIVRASILVNTRIAGRHSLDSNRESFERAARAALIKVQNRIPEVTENNFEAVFWGYEPQAEEVEALTPLPVFAEFKKGKLSITPR